MGKAWRMWTNWARLTLTSPLKKNPKQRPEKVPAPKGRIPKNLTLWQRVKRKLRAKVARVDGEALFDQIKGCRKLFRFLPRGLEKIQEESDLRGLTHSILKLYRHGQAGDNGPK